MNLLRASILLLLCFAYSQLNGQEIAVQNKIPHPDRLAFYWPAQWITHPTASVYDFGVYHFRRNFELKERPEELIVNISADNRYRLFVNGQFAVAGPSRGDLLHWRFETIDIAPFLQEGKNTIAALVWNYGADRAVYQISLQTAFVLQADQPDFQELNTNSNWVVFQDQAYTPITDGAARTRAYLVTGPRLQIDGQKHPWDWEKTTYDDSGWLAAKTIRNAKPLGNGTEFHWELVPRAIPLNYEKEEAPIQLRKDGMTTSFMEDGLRIIPANTTVDFLLDQTYLTNAYPYLQVSQGAGSRIRLEYGESLFDVEGNKGNRNEVGNKDIRGYYDIFLPDGGPQRTFTTPWFRVWRYIKMTITTGDNPLLLEKFYSKQTGYPFEEKAHFEANYEGIDKIWEVGWRTAMRCAGETYVDCPYYEQLQYVGDTRIQALISLYVSGDDRLMRKAIQEFDDSRLSNGLTMSRYPSASGQIIPPYSLFWINMVHDYWMHRPDEEFVRSMLPGVRSIIDWHLQQINNATDLLGKTPFWNFVDWAGEWPWDPKMRIGGVPPTEGGSSILSLQLVYAMQAGTELLEYFGETHLAGQYKELQSRLSKQIMNTCWDNEKGLIADTPDKKSFSQHANIMGVLTDAIPQADQALILQKIRTEKEVIPTTFYYRFYLMQALYKVGLGNDYLAELKPWYDMLALG
ncbi:MAG: alpha-rhamnosidase, partial [Lewinella sp.]|nr:alpha-rhamnosidase [Lewinella sp.]